ncbi:pheromone receptor [Ophiocordyceps camponoti-floridani]|uniref:Pheromone receptor n=1 Tax=Ophiocordyceps camponoti-floridani TaxID=2030778 RepID=A0A8H4VCY1_9HYPO|nr:pheromone receptor [Ophiocordyceps camponoti-floridani]
MDPSSEPGIHFLGGNQTAVVGPQPSAMASLTHNLILRVTLALAANAVCLVPLRVLRRNGEFAAAVCVISVELLNFEAILCALIWRDDDVSSWWPGYGLCDIVIHLHNALTALFISCLLAIMRNLYQQVGLARAGPLHRSERRRRNLVQALIIFPLPLFNLALTLIIAERRYVIGTLMGCTWAPHSSWPNLAFFVFPPVVLSVITVVYAALTYFRFREIAKTTRTALSNNPRASRRSQRTKRRLYLMVTAIMVPTLPLVVAVAVANVLQKSGGEHFDFYAVHNQAEPPWSVILFYPSSEILWINLNNCYINVLVAIPIFGFFGTTKDAINEYRLVALANALLGNIDGVKPASSDCAKLLLFTVFKEASPPLSLSVRLFLS